MMQKFRKFDQYQLGELFGFLVDFGTAYACCLAT